MYFLAWLNAPLVSRLVQVVEGTHHVHATSRRDEFLRCLREFDVDVAVIDPSLQAPDRRRSDSSIALALARSAPNAAVIIYGHPVQHVVAEFGALARSLRVMFVARDARDEADQLQLAVRMATAPDPTFDLLSRLRPPLARLPNTLARALVLTLEHPEDVHRVADVASAAGKSERTLNRWLDSAGLHSAGYFVTAAHLLFAYRLLRQPRMRVADVAERLGYASVNHFREAVRRAIACSPRELRLMHSNALAERMAAWLARPEWVGPVADAPIRQTPTELRT